MDPAAWDYGTASLSLEQEAAYLRVVNAIHKHDGPVPNIDRVLAGMFRCSTRKARALIDCLVDAGKLAIEDGKIWNDRARSDLVHRQLVSGSAQVRGAKGGRTRAKNAAKSLKNDDVDQATASSRIEENRREYSEGKPSDGETVSFTKEVFDRGVAFLGRYGIPESKARPLIGKWRKEAGDADTFNALKDASREGVTEPVAWITARLGRRGGNLDLEQAFKDLRSLPQ